MPEKRKQAYEKGIAQQREWQWKDSKAIAYKVFRWAQQKECNSCKMVGWEQKKGEIEEGVKEQFGEKKDIGLLSFGMKNTIHMHTHFL